MSKGKVRDDLDTTSSVSGAGPASLMKHGSRELEQFPLTLPGKGKQGHKAQAEQSRYLLLKKMVERSACLNAKGFAPVGKCDNEERGCDLVLNGNNPLRNPDGVLQQAFTVDPTAFR